MKTNTLAVGLLAAALGTACCGAFSTRAAAQADTAPAKPFTLKLGAFLPSSSALKNGVGDTWLSAGLEYGVPSSASAASSPVGYVGYVDYAGINRHGINASYVGVGPGVRFALAAPASSTLIPYVGAGAGAYFLHASGFGSTSNKTQFGYRLNAGVELNRTYLFEINYTDAGSFSGTRISGFNIQAGVKF